MNYGVHNVPAPLQDEDKWAKLTIRQWIILLPAVIVAVILLKITWDIGLLPIGVALSVVLLLIAWCIAFIELPDEKYLFGSRTKLEKLGLRLLWKRMPWNKKIYTKNCDNGYGEWLRK